METETNTEKVSKLAEFIKKTLENSQTYTFHTTCIDGIFCTPVLYKNPKVINIECVYIKCHVIKSGETKAEKYSLYHKKYDTIEDAVRIVMRVANHFKIIDGDLLSPNTYAATKLEFDLMPYTEHQTCGVCLNGTLDITLCGHHLCIHCRQKCVMAGHDNCPTCRKPNMVSIYSIESKLINNECYPLLVEAMNLEYKYDAGNHYEDNTDADDADDADDDDDDDDIFGDDTDDDDDEESEDEENQDVVVAEPEPEPEPEQEREHPQYPRADILVQFSTSRIARTFHESRRMAILQYDADIPIVTYEIDRTGDPTIEP